VKIERAVWPPADAQQLLDRWREMESPVIPLSQGLAISNLERWFYPSHPHWPRYPGPAQLERVREELAAPNVPEQGRLF